MTGFRFNDWQAANYQYLMQCIEALRSQIKRSSADSEVASVNTDRSEFRLDRLCCNLDLSAFERNLLLLAVGLQLSADLLETCNQVLDRELDRFDFNTALSLLQKVDWQALSPQAPLRYWQLIEAGESALLLNRSLYVAEPILHYLVGAYACDERLATVLTPVSDLRRIPVSYPTIVEQIIKRWAQISAPLLPLHLYGNDLDSQRYIIQEACSQLHYPLFNLDIQALPSHGMELNTILRLLVRETILYPNVVYLLEYDDLSADKQRVITRLVEDIPAHCVLIGQEPLAGIHFPVTTLQVPLLSVQEQLQLWQQVLNTEEVLSAQQLNPITEQFSLNATQIHSFVKALETDSKAGVITIDTPSLWQHCRHSLRRKAEGLAQVIEPKASWHDLSLPATQTEILHTLVLHIRQRSQVYQQGGFAEKTSRGLGICALFAGPSGTGKTLAAEVIAHELALDVYHIDLSAIVSKYIGETEKHLKRIFDHAESSGAVLLFDEADALFGKRSEVKDSHDRYANLEVSYLLQQMEAYRGLSILTTNLRNAIDDAFLRRIRFIVQFPFPDHAQRMQIWQRIFPAQTPIEKLAWEKLARLNISGGHIRNIALNAAFLAARHQQPISMQHLLQAAQSEYLKLEKTLTENEIRDWV
jgi:ATPase family associated with various cellular activities (AAA)